MNQGLPNGENLRQDAAAVALRETRMSGKLHD